MANIEKIHSEYKDKKSLNKKVLMKVHISTK